MSRQTGGVEVTKDTPLTPACRRRDQLPQNRPDLDAEGGAPPPAAGYFVCMLEPSSKLHYSRAGTGVHMHEKLILLAKRMKDEQRQLLMSAAEQSTMPSVSTVQRVAMLELNIAAIENTIADAKA